MELRAICNEFVVKELKLTCVFKWLLLRFLQILTNATVTLALTMERVLINQTALTAAAQTDLLATDVKQVRGNCMQFAMNFLSKGMKVYLCF